jgi:hypothetical protein
MKRCDYIKKHILLLFLLLVHSLYAQTNCEDLLRADLGSNDDLIAFFEGDAQKAYQSWNTVKASADLRTHVPFLGRVNGLSITQQAALKTDLDKTPALLAVLYKQPELLDGWKLLQKANPNSFVKTDVARLQVFHKLTQENQKLLSQFTDDGANATLARFLDDCDEDFIRVLNQPEHLVFVKGITAYKDQVSLSALELEQIGERLDLNEANVLNKWLKRSKDLERFIYYTGQGRKLGDNITNAIKTKNPAFLAKLKAQMNVAHIEEYEVLTEIPLKTQNGFMKADIVLILRNEDDVIIDTIILENKLSQATAFTPRQKEGFGAILNGQESFRLQYDKDNLSAASDVLKITKEKIFKIADHGQADDLENLTVERITKTN